MPLERYKALGLNEDSEFDNQPCNSLDEVIKASKAISHRNQVVLVVDMREKCFAVTAGDSDLLDTPNNKKMVQQWRKVPLDKIKELSTE